MSFPRYPAYKPSGVEWLGEVPEHWGVKPLKTIASINDEVLPESLSPDYEIEYVDIGSVSLANGIEKTEAMPFGDAPSRARRIPRDGDVLVSTVRTYLKAIAPVVNPPSNLVASTGFAVVRPRHELEPGFLKYALQEEHFIQQVISRSTGVSYPAINASDVAKISLNLPGSSEQLAIATFLDHETAKIDALIAEQQRLIELLQEKRLAVISHAVTKGLNPDAPMKDSGVEWLGEVPEHWGAPKIKHRFRTTSGSTPNGEALDVYYTTDDDDEAIPWIRTTDISNDEVNVAEVFITPKAIADTACSVLPANTVLVALYGGAGTVGKNGILKIEAAVNQALCAILPSRNALPEYVHAYVQFLRPFWMERAVSARKAGNISQELVRDTPFPLPAIEEQQAILDNLNKHFCEIDLLESNSIASLVLLEERRSALISAAVTGQIDVRGLVPETEAA
jgi:type I restriction enzyme S subunit